MMHPSLNFIPFQEEGDLPPLTSTGLDQQSSAQEASDLVQGSGGGGDMFTGFLWIGLLLAFLWLVVIRPENKRQKEMKNLRAQLTKGDQIVTSGGIHGRVSQIEGETLVIKVDEKVKLKLDRNAVARVESSKDEV